ncbi:hypothetical protein [Rhodococcus sp. NPDC058514]|uniref:hypothetical protein n=1 Tax=unclassified Rhodococcus (in: high G+C Gram-positive bacteria) TaxID=192944 RepID=UPI00364B3BEA
MNASMHHPAIVYGRVLRRRWRWVVWGALLALGVGIVGLLLVPSPYRSTATVFIRTPGDVSGVVDGGDTYARQRALTYVELAGSTDLAARVVSDLGIDSTAQQFADRITATSVPGTVLIEIAVSAPSAAEAQQAATVFLSEFSEQVRMLESVPGSLVPRAELVVVDAPGSPTRSQLWGAPAPAVLLGAVLVGVVLGATGAVMRSLYDRSVGDPRDAALVSGRPVLGSLDRESTGVVSDAARLVRHRLLSVMGDPDGGVIAFTEPVGGTAAAVAAAVTLAAALRTKDESVVLVDLDLRSHSLTEHVVGQESPGVSDVLRGRTSCAAAVQDLERGPFLGAGSEADSPAELIDSPALPALIGELRERYDWVLLVCPPAMPTADVGVIAGAADAVVILARQGVTTENDLLETLASLPGSTASGVVLDRVSDPSLLGVFRSGERMGA